MGGQQGHREARKYGCLLQVRLLAARDEVDAETTRTTKYDKKLASYTRARKWREDLASILAGLGTRLLARPERPLFA